MASSEGKKITLKVLADGKKLVVDKAVAVFSRMIRCLIEVVREEDIDKEGITIPHVDSRILAMVMDYCKKHAEYTPVDAFGGEDKSMKELRSWDSDFVKVDQVTLFDLILAADFLDIKCLLRLTCLTVVDMMVGKTPEEIFKTFNFKRDMNRIVLQRCYKNMEIFRIWRDSEFVEANEETMFGLQLAANYVSVKRELQNLREHGKLTHKMQLSGNVVVTPEEDEAVATVLQIIRAVIKDISTECRFLIPSVKSKIVTMVLEYYKKHVECTLLSAFGDEDNSMEERRRWNFKFVNVDQKSLIGLQHVECTLVSASGDEDNSMEELRRWDSKFVNVDQKTLFGLQLAAYYLNIKGLLFLTCGKIAVTSGIKNFIRLCRGLKFDYEEEEEEERLLSHMFF